MPTRKRAVLLSLARPPWPLLFSIAACGIILSLLRSGHLHMPAYCGAGPAAWPFTQENLDALRLLLFLNPPSQLALDWALMLVAMMPPLLALPLAHVWRSSRPRRRARAVTLFLAAYVLAWMSAALLLIPLSLQLRLLAGDGAILVALGAALTWSASPWHRAALNRSHRLPRVGLFGAAADRDSLRFGIGHGRWCIASCWAWMLVPLVVGQGHSLAMLLAGAIMLAERLGPPGALRWRTPLPVSLLDWGWLAKRRQRASAHG